MGATVIVQPVFVEKGGAWLPFDNFISATDSKGGKVSEQNVFIRAAGKPVNNKKTGIYALEIGFMDPYTEMEVAARALVFVGKETLERKL
jgi:hypothetical protein